MFHTLHKTIAFLLLAGLAVGVWWIYQSGLIQDAYWISSNYRENSETPPTPVIGQVTGVISGNEFYLQLTNRMTYRMSLAGIKTPRPTKGVLAAQAPERLFLDVLINQQTVAIHHGRFGRNNYGKGYVEVGGTNVNAVLIASRKAVLDREQIRALPFGQQFALLRAEHKARP